MRTHSSIIARLITLAFLLLCVAPTGLGAGGLAGSARAAAAAVPHSGELLGGQPQLQGLHQAMKPWTLTLQTTAALTPTATLTIGPTTFAPGDEIKVQGAAFAGGERIAISLVTSSGSAAVPIGIARADKAGSFGPMTIRVPFNAPAGQVLVVASGQRSGQRATVVVTVHATIATLVISPTAAKPGEAITVTGTHFQPGESVAVDLVALASSARLGTTQANAAGSFSLHAIVPANTPQGTLNAVATGAASHISSTAPITIGSLPAGLTIGSGSVKAGETLSVSGKGFIPGETISIRLTGGTLTPLTLVTVVANISGSFSIDKLVIPSLVPSGAFTLTASGQTSGRSATGSLTVVAPPPAAPIISILDTTHVAGSTYLLSPGGLVQLAGSNFPAGSRVTLALVGSGGSVTLAAIGANSKGALGPVGITLPANTPAGLYTLQALIGGKQVASLDTKVAALTPHLTLSTGILSPGAMITVDGSGFAPGEQVILALNGSALLTKPTAVLADGNGHFSVTFTVPATVINGANIVIASGVNSRASISVNLTASLPVATRWYFVNGDTTGDHHTTITMLNPGDAPATVKMTFLYQDGPERTATQAVPAHSVVSVALDLVAGPGRHVSTILEADRQISAESRITFGTGDATTALGASGPAKTWYLAEGYTNGSFREQIAVLNPAATFATIDVRFLPFNDRPAREVRFVMQPRSNITIDAGQYMPGQSISAVVTANTDVVVERTMRFGAGGRGAHDKIGVTNASSVWLFAQGEASADHQTFFTILNPNQAAPAAVTATFFDRTGKPIGTRTIVVNPLRRGNIKLNDVLPSAEVATILTSNVPVVVERPDYNGPANLGLASSGSVIFGSNGGGLSWALPGGSTADGTQSRIFLFNPGLTEATVHAAFYSESGAMVPQDLTLPPNSDTVLNVNTVPGLAAGHYGAVLKSTNNQVFLAEQSELNTRTQQATSTQGVAQ